MEPNTENDLKKVQLKTDLLNNLMFASLISLLIVCVFVGVLVNIVYGTCGG